jgi:Zn-dependent protease
MSLLGFIIAAPGSVHFFGHYNPNNTGKIAYAGPLSNIIVAIIFFSLTFVTNFGIIYYIYFINAALAVFNLLPFPGFDGAKVFAWNKTIYIITGIIALFLYSVPMMIV